MIITETERLWLREATEHEAAFVLELVNTPAWLAFIGDRDVHSIEAATAYLKNGPINSYAENGFGSYCLIRKADGIPVGMCGLHRRQGLPHPDLGFALLPQYEGMGYAAEASKAVLQIAKEQLNMTEVLAITTTDNERSIALLKRLGFSLQGAITLPGDNEVLNCFRITLTT